MRLRLRLGVGVGVELKTLAHMRTPRSTLATRDVVLHFFTFRVRLRAPSHLVRSWLGFGVGFGIGLGLGQGLGAGARARAKVRLKSCGWGSG